MVPGENKKRRKEGRKEGGRVGKKPDGWMTPLVSSVRPLARSSLDSSVRQGGGKGKGKMGNGEKRKREGAKALTLKKMVESGR